MQKDLNAAMKLEQQVNESTNKRSSKQHKAAESEVEVLEEGPLTNKETNVMSAILTQKIEY